MPLIFGVVIAILLSGCQFFEKPEPPRPIQASLSQQYALERKQHLSQIRYDLQWDLTNDSYLIGTNHIKFLLQESFFLSLDFVGGEILSLRVNNHPIKDVDYNGSYLTIPEEFLVKGENQVEVEFRHPYSQTGKGLYRFKDQDGRVYLSSDLKPYFANQLYPCFDQPDLKAQYVVEVRAPKDWQVITTLRETEVIDTEGAHLWRFPMSPPLSPHSYSLHAGDYQVWQSEAELGSKKLPLRLFSRQSLSALVPAEEWLGLTEAGLKFFEKHLQASFPFDKYDQLLVPDLNQSSLENAAAVVFQESFITQGAVENHARFLRDLAIFQKLAQMWFGNSVSMKWWDDQWLNESLATLVAYEGLASLKVHPQAWGRFAQNLAKAYRLDQSANTRPIIQDVKDTTSVASPWDGGLTAKSAAILRQLGFLVGDKKFGKTQSLYLEKFRETNADSADFFTLLSEVTGQDFQQWQERWLKTAMVNRIEVFFDCHKDRIRLFEIYQNGTQEFPTLRTHRTNLVLLKRSGNGYRTFWDKSILYSGERTEVPSLKGKPCPDIAYPNHEGMDYVLVKMDPTSLENIKGGIGAIADAELRAQLWNDIWLMVLNGEFGMEHYLQLVEFDGLFEEDEGVLAGLLSNVNRILKEYYPADRKVWQSKRDIWLRFFEQSYLARIDASQKNSARQQLWFESLVELAEQKSSLQILAESLKGRQRLPLAFELNREQRWRILASLSRNGFEGWDALLAKEEKSTSEGRIQARYVKALAPSIEQKRHLLREVMAATGEDSLSEKKATLQGLFPPQQVGIKKQLEDQLLAGLKQLSFSSDPLLVEAFVAHASPLFCDHESEQKLDAFLKAERNLPLPVFLKLRESMVENSRCLKLRAKLDESSAPSS